MQNLTLEWQWHLFCTLARLRRPEQKPEPEPFPTLVFRLSRWPPPAHACHRSVRCRGEASYQWPGCWTYCDWCLQSALIAAHQTPLRWNLDSQVRSTWLASLTSPLLVAKPTVAIADCGCGFQIPICGFVAGPRLLLLTS